jgi:hypothetical protein
MAATLVKLDARIARQQAETKAAEDAEFASARSIESEQS